MFQNLPGPRQRAEVLYPLDEVLLLCLLAVLVSAQTISDMARFGDKKLAFMRRFRPFADDRPATTSATFWQRIFDSGVSKAPVTDLMRRRGAAFACSH